MARDHRRSKQERGGQKGGAPANRGRVAAVHVLVGVEDGGHAEDLLAELKPEGPDGRLAWFAVFGVLRHRAEIDGALAAFLKQPLSELDSKVRAVLRLGTYEKFHGRSPDHAVVQQWVQAARKAGAGRAHGLVNAILRRVKPLEEPTRAQELNHPSWLWKRWRDRYGEAQARRWCLQNQATGDLCLVARDATQLDALLEQSRPVEGVPNARWSASLVGIDEGISWVMDPAAAMVADQFAAAVGQGRVLDACAAPGGKSARLWATGLTVVAADRERRLGRLRENLERLGADVEVRARDWDHDEPEQGFDGVLIDAPCTGLGTLRRHPEIRWRRQKADLVTAAQLQRSLLERLAPAVRVGGVVGYAVCSPAPEEGSEVIRSFLVESSSFEQVAAWSSAPPPEGHDGHQLFLLRRIA